MSGRRGHGEGSIYQRADGRWCGVAHAGYEHGTRRRKYVYGRTRQDVARKLEKAQADQQRGAPVCDDAITLGRFVEDWWLPQVRPSVRPTTYEGYEQVMRKHVLPELGRHRLTKLTPRDLQALMASKLGELSPRSVRKIRDVLRIALAQAERWDMVPRNVARLVTPPKVERPTYSILEPGQTRALLAAVEGHELEGIIAVALTAGLRRGECLALRWEDVDLDAAELRVTGSLQRLKGGGRVRLPPKTERSRRTVPLVRAAVAALRRQRAAQARQRLRAGRRWHGSEPSSPECYVFTNPAGQPFEESDLASGFRQVLDIAKLPKMRFHDLRHSAASTLFALGVPARIIMETLGHSMISTTLDIYTHVTPTALREGADALDAFLGEGGRP